MKRFMRCVIHAGFVGMLLVQTASAGVVPSLEDMINSANVAKAVNQLEEGLEPFADDATIDQITDYFKEYAKLGLDYAKAEKEGESVSEDAYAALDRLGDALVGLMPGDASKKAMEEMLGKLREGDLASLAKDVITVAANAAADYARRRMEQAAQEGLEQAGLKLDAIKEIAESIVNAVSEWLTAEGIDRLVLGANSLEGYVQGKLEEVLGGQLAKEIENFLSGDDPWGFLEDAAEKAIEQFASNALQDQLDKLGEKYPVLGEILGACGITGESLVEGIKNILGVIAEGGSFSDVINAILDMGLDAVKNLLQGLIQWGLNKLEAFVNGLITKGAKAVTDWLRGALEKMGLDAALIDRFCACLNGLKETAIKEVKKYGTKTEVEIRKLIDGAIPSGKVLGTP
ncbi:MAG: hypothetical protein FWF84_03175 [Kiritimatiellaeota bacterium]|nr:hypothetical protein [Kiritimatiellota bacterium]